MTTHAPAPAASCPEQTGPIPLWRSLVVLVLAALTIGLCRLSPTLDSTTEAGVNMTLPSGIGPYWGQDQQVSEAEKLILPPDTEFARKLYHSVEGDEIICSIVLSGAEKRSIHRPEVCLPGQGWTVKSAEVEPIRLPHERTLKVMNLTLQRQVQVSDKERRILSSYYMYWFVGKDTTTPYHEQRVWLSSWDRVFRGVNHRWAYVIVTSHITEGWKPNGRSAAQTLLLLKDFISRAAPTFQKSEIGAGSTQR